MTDASGRLPHFERPPVTRVVVGLAHERLASLGGAHIGAFWAERNRNGEYPKVVEFVARSVQLERFDGPTPPEIDLDLVGDLVEVPRVVMTKADGVEQTAIQSDSFEVSWHRATGAPYPRFEWVRERFAAGLEAWRRFLGDQSLGELRPVQVSFTYFNVIARGQGWDSVSDLQRIFRIPAPREDEGTLEIFHYADHTVVIDTAGIKRRVNLNFLADPVEAEKAAATLTISCAGPVTGRDDDALLRDVDACHEHALRAFMSATTEQAQLAWGRMES